MVACPYGCADVLYNIAVITAIEYIFRTCLCSFHPWTKFKVFGSATDIMGYLNEVVDTYDLRQHMRFNCKVAKANFDSLTQRWVITLNTGKTISARFVISCTGYFRYDTGFTPDIKGMADFQGEIFHSQTWPSENYPLKDRRVVVVGSGASTCVHV